MGDSLGLELDYIYALVDGIRDHWDYLNTPYSPLGFEPATFYLPWLERHFHEDWLSDERARQRLADCPNLAPAIGQFIPTLGALSHAVIAAQSTHEPKEFLLKAAAREAYRLATKAVREPLDEAELNKLGWCLTDLVARGDQPLRDALRAAAKKAGQKGGQRSAETRKETFAWSAAQTCQIARQVLNERTRPKDQLVGVLVARLGLSRPAVIRHLRTEGLYPAVKKRKTQS
ncbi:MAG: hypothetical protein JKY26_08945 [Pseudomonas sp.]|nr:hypothetical protein [Pseudomonas sp.]PHR10903.1 MAG: hypothetical protein COA41_20570 [Sphingopyxis sp.]